ncbi:hypothetical protein [uncultured Bradyrhizobium sp.]|uniref:hypothetical protein n=1 Tax=uncultured Bradyrhizobium sp. TaxID=199684 RepID=UPI00262DB1E8|nr:hypothetical protein [uncultured Bradyrhizobium sp.]
MTPASACGSPAFREEGNSGSLLSYLSVAIGRSFGHCFSVLSNISVVGASNRKLSLDVPTVFDRVDAALIGATALVALYFFFYPVWRSQFLIEIWFTETWNAYFQDAAAAWKTIYPAPSALVVNNYPPLSFYCVGSLGNLLADNLFVGRWLSLVALIAVSVEIFVCVRALAGGIFGPAIGALWYVAIMSHNFTNYVGANDPQLAGEAILGGGLAWLLTSERSGVRSALGPLLVMVIGGFWKHSMIAIPLTAVIWLLARHRASAIPAVVASVIAATAGLALCGAIFGSDFFRNLFTARDYDIAHLIGNLGHLQWSALAALIWLCWVFTSSTDGARFTALHVPIALASCIVQWFGDKIYGNAEFDLILALGIAIGVTCASLESSPLAKHLSGSAAKITVVSLLLFRLLASDRQETLLVLFDPQFAEQFAKRERTIEREAAQVTAIEGDVYCPIKTICRSAGKPFVVDDFRIEEMLATGLIEQNELDKLLAVRNITTFRSDPAAMGTIDTSLSHAVRRGLMP